MIVGTRGKMEIKSKEIRMVDIDSVIPNPKNPNKHDSKQIERLCKLIKNTGFRNPLVVSNQSGFLIVGHGRLESAKNLGMKEVPVIFQDFKNEADEYAYMTAENAIGSWSELDLDLINSEIVNFEDLDLDLLGIEDFKKIEPEVIPLCDEDEVPEVKEPIAKRGDIWILGNHRLMCGDSTMIDDVEKLMNGEKADLLHTDPPYNVNYTNADRPKAGKTNLGHIKNDKMDGESFYQFLYDAFICAYNCCKQDSMAYIWHTSSEHVNFTQALIDSGWGYNQQIIWKKPMLLGRGRYQWAHEPCLTAVKGKPWFTDDRTKTTVWDFGGYDKSKNVHPTQKPVVIPEEAINNSSKEGSNIMDLFLGSGSTLIACEKTNRKCFGMELDEKYCDVIINRWQNFTGKKAVLESNGKTYEELVNGQTLQTV